MGEDVLKSIKLKCEAVFKFPYESMNISGKELATEILEVLQQELVCQKNK